MVVEEEEEVVEEEELSGDQVFFPRANNCLYSQQIEQTLLQAMAGFEDEEFGEVDNEEKEDEEREEENERWVGEEKEKRRWKNKSAEATLLLRSPFISKSQPNVDTLVV